MAGEIAGRPHWEVGFDERGNPDQGEAAALLAELPGKDLTDLLVFSHGWNSDGYTLRELQPSADKLDLSTTHPDRAAFEEVIAAMGELTAWAQLRCAGRDGAADGAVEDRARRASREADALAYPEYVTFEE